MISADDFIHLAFTEDLSEAAVIHLCRNLSRMGGGNRITGRQMRRTIAATSVQLALRRYLVSQGVEFGVSRPSMFAPHESPNIMVGRRTMALETFLITDAAQSDALAENPGLALQAPALVPSDRLAAAQLQGDDVLLFALVNAGSTRAPENRRCWMHVMPPAWRRPGSWAPLGPLVLKSEAQGTFRLELGGEMASGEFHQVELRLAAGQRTVIDLEFHSIGYVRAAQQPAGRIGVRSAARQVSYLISPAGWENVWLDGRDICLLGWLSRCEFSMHARQVPPGARVFQFNATKVKNLAVQVSNLKPIQGLIELLRR